MPLFRLLALLLLLPALAHAAPVCRVPQGPLPARHPELPTADEPARTLPVASYTLSVSWSPQHCRTARDAFQCGARRFGWVLHGLWPDGPGKQWPQYCRRTPMLPDAVVRPMLCTTPSPQLVEHEWQKHGSCMTGYTPARYFALERRLFAGLRFPEMAPLADRPLDAASFRRIFAAANPGMGADMMRLFLDGDGWLKEVWLCLDTRFRLRTCPAHAGGAAGTEPVRIWQASGAGDPAGARPGG